MQSPTFYRKRIEPEAGTETPFARFLKIDPVAIIYQVGREWRISEHVSAARLLRELHRIGRDGLALLAVMSPYGQMDTYSVAALNCYLRHGAGLDAFKRAPWRNPAGDAGTRYAWEQLQEAIAARWIMTDGRAVRAIAGLSR